MSIMGTRVLRKEDPQFLTAGATYTADVQDPLLAGAAYVHYVRSPLAHASITGIDSAEAAAMPGVLGVFTAQDMPELEPPHNAVPMFPPSMMNRQHMAAERVRFVGEPVAAVVAETAAQAADAAELVFVDYDPLPAEIDFREAINDNHVIFEDVGTNTAIDLAVMGMVTGIGEEDIFADCEVVVEQDVANHRTAPAPLEGRSMACAWDGDKLNIWASSQSPYSFKLGFLTVYGMEPDKCRVVCPDVGGGFGQKMGTTADEINLPWLSQKVNRPLRWTETRTENLTACGHGRAQQQKIKIGGTKDGQVTAYRLEILGDAGAYSALGAFLPYFTHIMAPGVYDIPKIETTAKSVITNTTPIVPYRGAGRPEATAAVERAMDLFAAECGLSPVEVRRKNLIPKDSFPYTTSHGTLYDTGDYETALDKALEAADYEALLAEQAKRRKTGDTKQLGIGVSVYVEITGGPAPGGHEFARVEVTPEGKARLYSGALSHGQSHATTFSTIVADQLGMDLDDVEFIQGDTDALAEGVGTFGSRSLQYGGSAVLDASKTVVDAAREIAANLLEANADDVQVDAAAGGFHVAGTPAVTVSWAQVAQAAQEQGAELQHEGKHEAECTYPFGAHVIVAEVDTETGQVTVPKVVTCDDSGTILNPNIVEGQRHGGIAQGIGQALTEQVAFDEDGNPITSNFADYGFISAAELPSFDLVALETPTPNNPLGAKGIGESGAIGSTPAMQSAVADALSHLGVRHVDLPLTPENVWRTINEASA